MTWIISKNRQNYIMEPNEDVVPQIKQILGNRFDKAAAMDVIELSDGDKYMAVKWKDGNLNMSLYPHKQHMLVVTEDREEGLPTEFMESRGKLNVVSVMRSVVLVGNGKSTNIYAGMQ